MASLLLCLPGIGLILGEGLPQRYPGAEAIDRANTASRPDPCLVRYRDHLINKSQLCYPSSSVSPVLAVMGDSHAAAFGTYLRTAGAHRGWAVQDFTKATCPQLGDIRPFFRVRPSHGAECAAFNKEALNLVRSDQRVRGVLLAGNWGAYISSVDEGTKILAPGEDPEQISRDASLENLTRGLADVVRLLRACGKTVWLVIDAPQLTYDPVLALRTNAIQPRSFVNNVLGGPSFAFGLQEESSSDKNAEVPINQAIRDIAARTGAKVLDVPNSLCQSDKCRFEEKGVPLYVDSQHLSDTGAKVALQGLSLFERP